MESPIARPVTIEKDRTQIKHGLSASHGPAHTGAFHAGHNELFASRFDGPGTNRKSGAQILVIAHAGAVGVKISDDSVNRLNFGFPDDEAGGQTVAQLINDEADLAEEKTGFLGFDPGGGRL